MTSLRMELLPILRDPNRILPSLWLPGQSWSQPSLRNRSKLQNRVRFSEHWYPLTLLRPQLAKRLTTRQTLSRRHQHHKCQKRHNNIATNHRKRHSRVHATESLPIASLPPSQRMKLKYSTDQILQRIKKNLTIFPSMNQKCVMMIMMKMTQQ